jgi:SAM-dependent methyltransferase
MATYVYDQEWRDERARLAGIEALWDPGSRALLAGLGVDRGWRCLEVGAGGGSMTEWLADRVGEEGGVVAADVSTRFLDALERPNVEVREHDIVAGGPLPPEFDLAYARLVVEHLGRPALERLVAAVRPGGLLVLEDYDWAAADVHPPDELFARVTDAVLGFMEKAGFDPGYGRRLMGELDAVGLEDVEADGRVRLLRGGSPGIAFYRLSLVSLRPGLVESGALSDEEVDEALKRIDDPERVYLSPIMVAGWGRKPA